MSMHDDGCGASAGPAPDLQCGFVNNQRVAMFRDTQSGTLRARMTRKNEVS